MTRSPEPRVNAAPAPSFDDLMQTMRAFQESRLLLTAVELDVFTAVGDGARADQVAAKLETDTRATETLLNALAAVGALNKEGDAFRNTPVTARFLTAASPEDARASVMHTVHLWTSWSTLTDCVRAGTAVGYQEMADRDHSWTEPFIAAMDRRARAEAPALVEAVGAEGIRRLLDIGGGSGAFSIAFALANPDLRAEIFDLPAVARIAEKHIDAAGLAGRVATRSGDLRTDDFGRDYDLLLLSAICHMLSPEENGDLFLRCCRALGAGGRLVIRDFILDPDKTAPRGAALFALNMLVNTRGGSSYSDVEYAAWLKEAGFAESRRISDELMVATRP